MAASHAPISILGSDVTLYARVIDSIDWRRVYIEAVGEHLRRGDDHAERGAGSSSTGQPQDVCAECIRQVLLEVRPGRFDRLQSIDPREATIDVVLAAQEWTGDDCENPVPIRIVGPKGDRHVIYEACGECRVCVLCAALDALAASESEAG